MKLKKKMKKQPNPRKAKKQKTLSWKKTNLQKREKTKPKKKQKVLRILANNKQKVEITKKKAKQRKPREKTPTKHLQGQTLLKSRKNMKQSRSLETNLVFLLLEIILHARLKWD